MRVSCRQADAGHVIVAAGDLEITHDIPGLDNACAMSVQDYYLNSAQIGDSVVIAGGQRMACGAALDLPAEGRHVALVFAEPSVCSASFR
jgi:pyruvate/2-oxoglutarate dehydrogenase complex dihydrolipoamide dehydrogenase (E3) component